MSQQPLADQASVDRNKLFERLPASIMASVLNRVFHSLQSVDVSFLVVKGGFGAVWLLSILCWVAPSDISVSFGDTIIVGDQNGKIVVNRVVDDPQPEWSFEEHYHLPKLDSVIWRSDDPRIHPILRDFGLPRDTIYHMLRSTRSLKETEALGQLALGLITAFYEGVDFMADNFPLKVPFTNVCSTQFAMSFRQSLEKFGWPPLEDFSKANAISEYFSTSRTERLRARASVAHVKSYHSIQEEVSRWYDDSIVPFLHDIFDLSGFPELEPTAVEIAASCLREAFIVKTVGFSHFRPKWHDDSTGEWLFRALYEGKMSLDTLLEDLIGHSDPATHGGLRKSTVHNLIIAEGRTVLYPKALLSLMYDLRELLTFTLVPGQLRFKDRRYPALLEMPAGVPFPENPAYIDAVDAIESVDWFRKLDSSPNFSITKKADLLLLHTRGVVGPASWFSSARQSLVFALRPRAMSTTPERRQQNIEFIRSRNVKILDPSTSIAPWISNDINDLMGALPGDQEGSSNSSETVIATTGMQCILRYFGYPLNDFYRASSPFLCFPMVIQGKTPLDECIVQAIERLGDMWVILASPQKS